MKDESPIKQVTLPPQEDRETVTNGTTVTDDDVKRVASSAKRPRKRRDAAPKKRTPKKEEASTLTSSELEFALAQVLTFPAIPAAVAGDDWAANHFTTQGPILAKELVKLGDRNPAVRRTLERIASGEAIGTLAFASIMYVLPPLVHWGIIPIPGNARGIIPGMPPMPEESMNGTAAQHMQEPDNGNNGSNGNRQERHTP